MTGAYGNGRMGSPLLSRGTFVKRSTMLRKVFHVVKLLSAKSGVKTDVSELSRKTALRNCHLSANLVSIILTCMYIRTITTVSGHIVTVNARHQSLFQLYHELDRVGIVEAY